jgi:thioredoxin reductase (NADPH)
MFDDLTIEELKHRANPVLPNRVVAALEARGERRQVAAGEAVFKVDDRDCPFIYVLSGALDVHDPDGMVLATLEPGQFTGEIGLLFHQTVFADCSVIEAGEIVLIPPRDIADLIQVDPEVSDLLLPAFAARRLMLMKRHQGTLRLIGHENAPALRRISEYAERNRIPYRRLDPANPAEAAEIKACAGTGEGTKVIVRGRHVIEEPSVTEVARALGLELAIEPSEPMDLIIAGAGPAGLSAAVYGASEGLRTLLFDDVAIGGQSAATSRIENFLGFPTGVSGADLAFRAELQAIKFGARLAVPRRAKKLAQSVTPGLYEVTLDDGVILHARSVVIATGARYRKLELPEEERFEGAGLFYAATELEARACKGREVVVVGGGNSAGQAAMFLAGRASCVRLVCRGPDLSDTMSQYLIDRLHRATNVMIEMRSEVVSLLGTERLESVAIRDSEGGVVQRPACGLFVMIGANPCTSWLKGAVRLDDRGFVMTGHDCATAPSSHNLFQTSLPGVFAVGDVRSGSVKRVASAVGEGSVVVQAIHARLAALRESVPPQPITA